MNRTQTLPLARHIACTLCALLMCAGACLAPPVAAHAETLGTDVVLGETAEERGLAASDLPDITAPHAIVVGADGTVYFERAADDQVKIASLTKLMTAIVAIENAEPTDTITVDHAAATVGESSANLREGDTMPLETALKALLVPSGNDAAMAIASSVGALMDPASDDPYGVFVDAMNAKAAELGLGAVFANPHGLDFGAWEADMHASARDVATMLAYAMQSETFRAADGSGENSITVTGADGAERTVTFEVWNKILGRDGNIGGKTGTTYISGKCFAGTFVRDGEEVYVVVLGCAEDADRFADTLALANWYYDHMKTVEVVQSEYATMDGAALVGRATDAAWTDKTVDVVAADPDATVRVFDLAGELSLDVDLEEFSGAVRAGDAAGTLTLSQGDEALASVDLVAAEDIAEPSPLEWLLVQFDRFTRWITGKPGSAPAEVLAEAPSLS
ncbi:D-alanyl-D-alanine carboxypeptidase family protein [[Collinsella] massiliensis]|uniref:Peptidase S11 n=1 Tax=[Collinsella] massiliensis TaxID=1232426 RepID=A0A1Y3XY94_9ACTN|nr:D-alanyl-D-alanine carboxypeptidase [[Collinsella] massiliensis]OUN86970.1 peptidase S11 [[Collinsella] massiliensis]